MSPRIRVILNKGQRGIALGKLATIADGTAKFLACLGRDLGTSGSNRWMADNFHNSSVVFDLEDPSIPEPEVERWRRGLRAVMANDSTDTEINRLIQRPTRKQFAAIQRAIDINESIEFGIYSNGDGKGIEAYQLSGGKEYVLEELPESLVYHGEIQGVVHSFYKEAKPQYLKVRQLCTDALITCYFPPQMYRATIETMEAENTVLFVEGEVTERLETGQIESIEVSDFHFAPDFDLAFHLKFIGSKPDLTGKKSSEEVVGELRAEA